MFNPDLNSSPCISLCSNNEFATIALDRSTLLWNLPLALGYFSSNSTFSRSCRFCTSCELGPNSFSSRSLRYISSSYRDSLAEGNRSKLVPRDEISAQSYPTPTTRIYFRRNAIYPRDHIDFSRRRSASRQYGGATDPIPLPTLRLTLRRFLARPTKKSLDLLASGLPVTR